VNFEAMAKKKGLFSIPSADELDKPLQQISTGYAFKRRADTSTEVQNQKKSFQNLGPCSRESGSILSIAQEKGKQDKKGTKTIGSSSSKTNCNEPSRVGEARESINSNEVKLRSSEERIFQDKPRIDQPVKTDAVQANNETTASTIKAGTNSIIVNARQRGNPVLKNIRNVPWEYGDIVPDYVLGQTMCALFLSLRYHNFNPEYIHERLKQLGSRFQLRILLVQVDVKNPHPSLKELSKICILADCTLILAWSVEEAGRYLETYKSYENKPADILQEKVEGDYQSKMVDCLTSVKSVNKTDAVTLMSNFGTLKHRECFERGNIYLSRIRASQGCQTDESFPRSLSKAAKS